MKFSQRIGKTNVREALQIDSIDHILENKLWNNILIDYIERFDNSSSKYHGSERAELFKDLWKNFLHRKIDEIPINAYRNVNQNLVLQEIKDWYINCDWFEKYDFIEHLLKIELDYELDFAEKVNFSLQTELAGYRIIQNQLVQVTAENEIETIEQALNNTSIYKSVETHLKTSLELLSNRNNPNFRNSIKESISAIEAFCIIITGDEKASLGKALAIIDEKYKLHNGLKKSFSALYGFTSDAGGIRHSLLEDDIDLTFEDAKFMLVSCSAFINYLKYKTII